MINITGILVMQEMTSPAPYAPPTKSQHTDRGADVTESSPEQGHFDSRPVAECYV